MDKRADIARCDAEIAACTEYLMHGGPDEIGAYVGLVDWQRERVLLEREIEEVFDFAPEPAAEPEQAALFEDGGK